MKTNYKLIPINNEFVIVDIDAEIKDNKVTILSILLKP